VIWFHWKTISIIKGFYSPTNEEKTVKLPPLMKDHYDVIVIGAGPAGSIASARLLQEGKTVLVLEKMLFPRFVIGESLLPHVMDYLHDLNLIQVLEQQNFQIKNGVCFHRNEDTCPFLFAEQFSKNTWNYTWQVKRADFDTVLINEVQKRGADVCFEATVTEVQTDVHRQQITFEHPTLGKKSVSADFLMDASGYGRVLPRLKQLEVPVQSPPRGSVFTHLVDKKRTENASENIFVHIFRNNTAWLWSIPFSDGTTSVGVVSDVDFISECTENDHQQFLQLVSDFPGLKGRFSEPQPLFAPRTVMNYAVAVKQLYGDGYVLCGNATEFLDPTFSSGVMFAVSSGYKAASLIVRHLNGEVIDWEKQYSEHIQCGINVFRSYVNAWYDGTLSTIFFSKYKNEDFMAQICSVLAGYVWDESNPFVKKHDKILHTLAQIIQMES